MATDSKHESTFLVIKIGIFIASVLLVGFTILAYLNHWAISNALKNIPSVSIHPATPADYPYYLQLYPDLEIDQPPSTLDTWTKHAIPDVSIITHDAKPVGYAWVEQLGEVHYLKHLVVGREHRRKGIGTAALKLLKKAASEKGVTKLGLHCDVLHVIPYKMYVKAGMHLNGQLFHLKAPSNSVKALAPQPKDYFTVVIYDPSKWTEMEKDYKIVSGEIASSVKRGGLPILMLDANKKIKGFTVLMPTSGTLCDLYIENSEDLAIFLNLLQTYRESRQANDNEDWIHFWISNEGCRRMSDFVLQTLPGAVICEQFDYLEGNTSE